MTFCVRYFIIEIDMTERGKWGHRLNVSSSVIDAIREILMTPSHPLSWHPEIVPSCCPAKTTTGSHTWNLKTLILFFLHPFVVSLGTTATASAHSKQSVDFVVGKKIRLMRTNTVQRPALLVDTPPSVS
jgi:hypothetical protein